MNFFDGFARRGTWYFAYSALLHDPPRCRCQLMRAQRRELRYQEIHNWLVGLYTLLDLMAHELSSANESIKGSPEAHLVSLPHSRWRWRR